VTALRALIGRFLPQGAVVLSVLTFGSYAMGLVRDRIFARTYGAGAELDAYNAAFVLPELLFDVFIAAGLAAPFVPIFMKLVTEETKAAEAFARTILTLAVASMGVAAIVLFIVAPLTVDLIAPGFTSPEQRTLYTDLFRVMCITPLIFATSIVLGEILVAKRRFLYYGIAPLLYNAGIVLGTLLLHDQIGIFGAAVGAVVGALLHLGIRLIGILRTDIRLRPQLALRMPAVREFLRLMVPRMAGAPIEPLTFQFFTRVASGFVEGSLSAVSFARNFQSVPVSLIGVAFSLAAFPGLSSAAGRGDRAAFVQILRTNVLTIAGLTILAGIGLFVLSTVAIELFLGGGAFDAEDVNRTATLLSAFALSVPIESLTYPLARAIYATRNTVLPVSASLAGLCMTVVATLILRPSLGLTAIPLAFALGSATKLVILAIALRFRIRRIPDLAGQELSETR
jgi:putative peptidoglycan lipid II flippase